MSQSKLAKLRNTDVFKACMRVLEEFRIPKEDFQVLDRRPHPQLTVRYCGLERMMSLPSTPKTRGKAPTVYSVNLRRMLKEMQMEGLAGEKAVEQQGAHQPVDGCAVVVGSTVIRRVEYRGEQVVTLAMIDEVHGRPDGTAGRVFRENRDRFENGQDFHQIVHAQNDEFRRYGLHIPNRGLLLITRRGYLKITKSLSDDRAWEVFDQMLDRYFAAELPQAESVATLGVEVRSVIGGIVKSIVHSELALIVKETMGLREQVAGLLIGSDPRVAVVEFVSVAQLLEEGKAVQKGRRSLNQRVGHGLQNLVLETGKASNRRRCPHSGKWLFQRDLADEYMQREGRRLIREHNDVQTGQTFMHFCAGGSAA
ncbi:ORF6N domain-containing protein [Shinella zoogloeoides]|uniref:ORF6N domain-containing protein n=1 Tax=Shinella zoogloeoides TaxID=352475 RepID=UPI00299DAFAF|nr:ORF6N domain-containing protein [Shinella zoogloeoides]WPE19882.1 hypothetical protein ShzoTeo12_10580 [Shinella zoogloeoides]